MKIIIPLFLIAFVSANLIVKHFGAYGLWFSSALLIPFDFVARCTIHERYKGWKLIGILLSLTVAAALITVAFNHNAIDIATGSVLGFISAQIVAGFYYQFTINESYFIKVNGSDILAIIADSLIFQWIVFFSPDMIVIAGQIIIKILGGLLWYFIIFKTNVYKKYITRL